MNEQGFAPSPQFRSASEGLSAPLRLVARASPRGSKRPLCWAEKGDGLHLTYRGDDAGHDHPASPQLIVLDICISKLDKFCDDAPYDAPTQSATKKARKDAQGLEKKRLKAETEDKEARERRERRQNRLEESRKVVLIEDPSLPTPTKVSSSRQARVVIKGLIACASAVQDREP